MDFTKSFDSLRDAVMEEIRLGRLRAALQVAAQFDQTLTYRQAGKVCGLFSGSSAFSALMELAVRRDLEEGRPPYCALIKGTKAPYPSEGFFLALDRVLLEKKLTPAYYDAEQPYMSWMKIRSAILRDVRADDTIPEQNWVTTS
jgi:hypothetical protein